MCHSKKRIAALGPRVQTEPHGRPFRSGRGAASRCESGGGAYRWLKPPVLRHPAWAVAAVLLIGFNLRPSITTVALFLGAIKRDLGVSHLKTGPRQPRS